MNLLALKEITKTYGEKILFRDLSFGISKGEKIALVANNGIGKSSLLKIITGKDEPDSGEISIKKGLRIGYLTQEPLLDQTLSIRELIQGTHSKVLQIIHAYDSALKAQGGGKNKEEALLLENAAIKMDQYSAWDYKDRLKQMLARFKITKLDIKIANLSGGEQKRLALALVLLDSPDLLILDEPTNHMDIDLIEWLESYLSRSNISLLMVTHDRYFLDTVCNRILEIEDYKLYHHNGNYAYFLEKRAEREEIERTETDKAKKLMKKELDWIRRMPKARTTKSKARIQNFDKIKEKAKSKVSLPEIKLEVKSQRIGGKILEVKNLQKSFGQQQIIKGFTYTFKKGECIGIIGENGVGKSTFLNILFGNEKADYGKIRWGDTIHKAYFKQKSLEFKEGKRVLELVKDISEVIIMANGSKLSASQFLNHFMFPPKMQQMHIEKLSGGEKRRLQLLLTLIQNPNFLILDEPTNDLDLLTLNKLEEFLMNFKGCTLIVSHDRYFMDKLVDHLFVFKGEGIIEDHYCNYTEYRLKSDQDKSHKPKTKEVEVKTKESERPKKASFKEKFEYEELDKEIAILEAKKKELESLVQDSGNDYEKLQKYSQDLSLLIETLDEKSMRWLELDELM